MRFLALFFILFAAVGCTTVGIALLAAGQIIMGTLNAVLGAINFFNFINIGRKL